MLGCAGSSYDPIIQDPCSSYLLETGQSALLLDCGYGSFDSWQTLAIEARLDAIFVSHAHRDHVADLEQFMMSHEIWRDGPRLVASEQTMSVIVPSPELLPDDSLIIVGDGSQIELVDFAVEFSRTTHQVPTLAACVAVGGSRVVYGADTGPLWVAPANFVGADVALLECTLEIRTSHDSEFHLDAVEVVALARQLSARTTVITHVPPGASTESRLEIAQRHAPNLKFIGARTGLQLTLN